MNKVVLILFHDGERREFELLREKTTIGRGPDNVLRVPSADVSRAHCEIVKRGDKLLLRDLGSSNGTLVNGKKAAEAELKAGDRLDVGPAKFVVQVDGKPAKPELPALPAAAAAAVVAAEELPELGDEDLLELGDGDFEVDDALSVLEEEDDDDEPLRK